jgi:hypothetical protein
MHEKQTFSAKINPKERLPQDEVAEEKQKLTSAERHKAMSEEDKALRLLIMGIVEEKYETLAYTSPDGSLRIRALNDKDDILYDDDFENFLLLTRKLKVGIGEEEIRKFRAQASPEKNS